MGSGPAGPTVERESFLHPWTGREVLLLGVGDSITAGFGVPSERTYFQMLLKNPPGDDPAMQGINLPAMLPNLKAENLARSGSTSSEHLTILENQLEEQSPDVFGLVVMTTGGNDLIHNYGRTPPREGAMYGATRKQARPWIANFEKRLDAMLDRIEAAFPGGCLILLADVYDPTDGVGDAAAAGLPDWPDGVKILRAYNDVLHRAAEKRESVVLVPLHDAFLGHGFHCRERFQPHYRPEDPYYWYAWNIEDPNTRGYDAIRRLFLRAVAGQRERIAEEKENPSG
ncbi:MAG: SGNH/GDSL hydrolase family protein [Pirellulales bacterium]|nr:SGNH/GDSL hydrolase family protein [Pirellulales bacterium]